MNKQEKERTIVEWIKELNECGCGDYRSVYDLREIIAIVMNYKFHFHAYGCDVWFEENGDEMKVREIIRRMVEKKVIKLSKSGKMFVLCVE